MSFESGEIKTAHFEAGLLNSTLDVESVAQGMVLDNSDGTSYRVRRRTRNLGLIFVWG
jgi:hypothetical protein